jgi:hypothetical protein
MTPLRTWTPILVLALLAGPPACDSGDDDGTADATDTADARDAADAADAADGEGADDASPDGADGETEAGGEADAEPDGVDAGPCDGMTDTNCVEVQVGERTYYRRLDEYDTVDIDDEGTTRTCVPLPDLIDAEVTATPEDFRYQVYGTDGYTYGGYATWTNMLNGWIELGNRRIYWDPSQMLPNSWNVRDSYLIVLSPAGG